jgi:hypothetical protein
MAPAGMPDGLVIIVPVLRRPQNVTPLLASIRENTVVPGGYRVLFMTSPGDSAEHRALRAAGAIWTCMAGRHEGEGDYARKINQGAAESREPYLFLGADDLRFHPGWAEAALRRMQGRIGVVGTNDLGNRRVMSGRHSTHSLVSREYVERFGTIDEIGKVLHEGYPHEFVDDELVGTARKRHAWAYAGDSVVEHLHPLWGKAPTDSIYDAIAARIRAGAPLYHRRRRLWA